MGSMRLCIIDPSFLRAFAAFTAWTDALFPSSHHLMRANHLLLQIFNELFSCLIKRKIDERDYVDTSARATLSRFELARLVVGGLPARLELEYERVDDLQLAVETALRGHPRASGARITIQLEPTEKRLGIWIGPLAAAGEGNALPQHVSVDPGCANSLERGYRDADRGRVVVTYEAGLDSVTVEVLYLH